MRQSTALSVLLSGQSVFLTGEPGAGKSHTVREFLRRTNRNVAITASTGIAATQIGGLTIHAWSGIGTREALSYWNVDGIARSPAGDRIRSAQVLIIDEVSMLSGDVVQMVDFVCRGIRGDNRPFGGLQVVFVGDFFQLPPVKFEKWQFAFNAQAWKDLNPKVCYLSERHRQSDETFLGALSAIRRGQGKLSEAVLASRCLYSEAPQGVPVLLTHNFNVDTLNAEQLGKLGGPSRTFQMTGEGDQKLVETLRKHCQSPEVLELKNGAAVMFTRNNPQGGFVNGTTGTVIDAHRPAPLVRLRDGSIVAAELASWDILAPVDKHRTLDLTAKAGFFDAGEDDDEPAERAALACIYQVPLRLSWAITVHKAQGMSLDAAVMDLSRSFAYGQGYVALSRVRTLGGLYLRGWNERALEVHPAVLAKDREFRAVSDAAFACAA